MTQEKDFDRAIAFVLKWEGGYVNDPRDPGGETKYGISKRAYPMLNIKDLELEDAKTIYKKDYWLKAGCGKLEWPLSLVHFDTAVNMGHSRAMDFNARALNWTDYLFLRIEHYCKLNKPEYLRGWINRVVDLWKEGKKV
ncbi:MAG: hypothetical protein HY886_08345 [Deltaproteobacteria bacterium]|nr:hypothetical protein [Deltaproteobacteria bacterium]